MKHAKISETGLYLEHNTAASKVNITHVPYSAQQLYALMKTTDSFPRKMITTCSKKEIIFAVYDRCLTRQKT